jgi:predicted enzyme related to lactoylglutathione lyase
MKLNHINLVVTNVAEAILFFETYFCFTCTEVKGDHIVAILKNVDGFTLVIMTAKEEIQYPDVFHIGFMQNTGEAVNDIYRTLISNGVAIANPPKKIRDSFGFYFTFDKIMIEVGYYLN